MDSLSTNLNPDTETGKDVTGAAYLNHRGYSPESDIEYKANSDDSIYEDIQKIVDELLKDEESTTFKMIDATLTEEVKNATGDKTLTGKGYMVNVICVPQDEGGDTSGYTINVNFYESGARTQGTVTVADKVPTFTAKTA